MRVNSEVEKEGKKTKHVKSLESVARLIFVLFVCLLVYSFICLSDFVRFSVSVARLARDERMNEIEKKSIKYHFFPTFFIIIFIKVKMKFGN